MTKKEELLKGVKDLTKEYQKLALQKVNEIGVPPELSENLQFLVNSSELRGMAIILSIFSNDFSYEDIERMVAAFNPSLVPSAFADFIESLNLDDFTGKKT